MLLFHRTLAVALLGLSCSDALAALASGSDDTMVPNDVAAEQRSAEEALAQIRNGNNDRAMDLLEKAIQAPAFGSLSETMQHQSLFLAAAISLDRRNYQQAQSYLKRSSIMSSGTGNDWLYRFQSDYALNDIEDAGQCLETLTTTWPEALKRISDEAILHVATKLQKSSHQDGAEHLLDALFKVHWTQEGGIEPSSLWRDLVLQRIGRGDLAGARSAAERVTYPYTIVAMRADNRYADVVKALPARFDVNKAAAENLANIRQQVQAHPRSLQWLMELTYSLLSLGRFDETLKITDDALARAKPVNGDAPAYDDTATYLIWLMDNRARALEGLTRWNEAATQMVSASRRPEHGDMNVSQAINLGFLYFELDQPDNALGAISEIGDVSPYGRMQVEMVRLVAALEKQDSVDAEKSLQYMREHAVDAPSSFLEALLFADRMDEASDYLQSRLNDPLLRSNALEQIQQYRPAPEPPRVAEMKKRLHQLCERSEVKAAIAKVGNVDHYEIYASED